MHRVNTARRKYWSRVLNDYGNILWSYSCRCSNLSTHNHATLLLLYSFVLDRYWLVSGFLLSILLFSSLWIRCYCDIRGAAQKKERALATVNSMTRLRQSPYRALLHSTLKGWAGGASVRHLNMPHSHRVTSEAGELVSASATWPVGHYDSQWQTAVTSSFANTHIQTGLALLSFNISVTLPPEWYCIYQCYIIYVYIYIYLCWKCSLRCKSVCLLAVFWDLYLPVPWASFIIWYGSV